MLTSLSVTQESFDTLTNYHSDPTSGLNWDLVFTLPTWLKVWWQSSSSGAELYLRSVKRGNKILGIAPLQIRGEQAAIIGNVNVCDYQDFITVPGSEREFFIAMLDDLQQRGIKELDLQTVRPDSAVARHLKPIALERNHQVDYQQVDVSLDMNLPQAWEEYLGTLDRKQRHELRRKMRNLQEAGETSYRVVEHKEAIPAAINAFLQLFPDSRGDKAEFMTSEMQTFFNSLAKALAEIGVVKFGILEFGKKIVAMIMYFDYNENVYLYNSAYDPDFKSLSVGVISKAKCIQDSIEKGKKRFDFLKGNEQYKYYLGGNEIPLYRCRITLQ